MICARPHNSSSWKLYVKWEITLGDRHVHTYMHTYIAKYKNVLRIYILYAFSKGERYTNYNWLLVN